MKAPQLDSHKIASEIFPKEIVETLNNEKNLLHTFAKKIESEKMRVKSDIEDLLKHLIKLMEDYQGQIFAKIDSSFETFKSFFDYFKNCCFECIKLAQDNVGLLDNIRGHESCQQSDFLTTKISQFQVHKENSMKFEEVLKQIKFKIDSYRLEDVNKDLIATVDKFDGVYNQHECQDALAKIEDVTQKCLDTQQNLKSISFIRNITRPHQDHKYSEHNKMLPEDLTDRNRDHSPEKNKKNSGAKDDMTYPIISAQSTTLTDVIELREPHVFVENQI